MSISKVKADARARIKEADSKTAELEKKLGTASENARQLEIELAINEQVVKAAEAENELATIEKLGIEEKAEYFRNLYNADNWAYRLKKCDTKLPKYIIALWHQCGDKPGEVNNFKALFSDNASQTLYDALATIDRKNIRGLGNIKVPWPKDKKFIDIDDVALKNDYAGREKTHIAVSKKDCLIRYAERNKTNFDAIRIKFGRSGLWGVLPILLSNKKTDTKRLAITWQLYDELYPKKQ